MITEVAGDALPAPVARWVAAARLDDLAGVETVGSVAHGRVRLGRLPWLPIDMRTLHRLGRDQVRDIRLRIGPVPLLGVLDAYVDGAGITKIGPIPTIGPEVDQGAVLAMWAEAIAWPAAWHHLPGLRWSAVDEEHARLHLPFATGEEVVDVTFDRASGFPRLFEVDRFKAGGRKVRWRAECSDLRSYDGFRAWSHVRAAWADDPGPWFEAWFDRIVPNVKVDRAVERARRAIAAARRRGAGSRAGRDSNPRPED
jgi:hypothetical protein